MTPDHDRAHVGFGSLRKQVRLGSYTKPVGVRVQFDDYTPGRTAPYEVWHTNQLAYCFPGKYAFNESP